MSFEFILLALFCAIAVAALFIYCHFTPAYTPRISWAGRQVIKAYNKLPENSRHYPDIKNIIIALDTKHGKDNVNRHFREWHWEGDSYPTWECSCVRHAEYSGCCKKYPQYTELKSSIEGIKGALEEQEHLSKVAAVDGDLQEVEILTQRLREEKSLINEVTNTIYRSVE